MSSYSHMTFTITKIESDKHSGEMYIYFVPNDGVKYTVPFVIGVKGSSGSVDRHRLRQSMLAWYEEFKRDGGEVLKVGDVI